MYSFNKSPLSSACGFSGKIELYKQIFMTAEYAAYTT